MKTSPYVIYFYSYSTLFIYCALKLVPPYLTTIILSILSADVNLDIEAIILKTYILGDFH